MFFDSTRRAQVRLVALYRLGVLDRFQPRRPGAGNLPYHYVVGPLGRAVLEAEADVDRLDDLPARRRRQRNAIELAGTQRLAHLVGINGMYAALVAEHRRSTTAELEDWRTEAEAVRWTGGIVRPDAWGRWREGDASVEFFVEWDRGTETHGRLADKLDDYRRFEYERGAAAWLLFVFASARREANARRGFADADLAVATTAIAHDRLSPADAVWFPLDAAHGRVRLVHLARLPHPAESTARARAGGLRGWRYQRAGGERNGPPTWTDDSESPA